MNPFIPNPLAYQRATIRAEAPAARLADGTATLRLYDPIDSWGGPWGVSAKEFVQVLDDLPDDTTEIRLLVNSPGGEVWEGLAILNALRAHPARVVAVVEGVAASAASFVAAGVDELVMAPNSELFIHNAWGLCVGNAADMAKMAGDLGHEDANIASVYAGKAGGAVDDWLAVMQAETWYSAEEAVDAGLADRVESSGSPDEADKAKNRFDLSIFNVSGRKAAEQHPVTVPVVGHDKPEGGLVAFSDEQLTHLRQQLGVADDADEAAILAALDHTLEKYVDPDTPPVLPEGVVAVDAAQLTQLQADAAAGREARAQQLTDQRERTVQAAIEDGRIPPARKDHWLALLAADPGAEQVLATLAKGTIPVSNIGHGGAVDLDSDDALYAQLFGQEVSA